LIYDGFNKIQKKSSKNAKNFQKQMQFGELLKILDIRGGFKLSIKNNLCGIHTFK